MATWIVHLRIADILLKKMPELSPVEFLVGNIAPDSGVMQPDGLSYIPSKEVSHFQYIPCPDGKNIDLDGFIRQYFTKKMQKSYSVEQKSFYFGYLCHLVTDIHWLTEISRPCMRQFNPTSTEQWLERMHKFKEDWYDLDFLFLKNHPDFPAFQTYANAAGFQNTFMPAFQSDAFEKSRERITAFYSQKCGDLDRVYPYLTKERVDQFVEEVSQTILESVNKYLA